MVSRVFLVTSLLFAGCSSSPGSKEPAPGDAGTPAAKSQETPTVRESAAPPEAGPSVPAATPGKTSRPPAMQPAQVAPPQRPSQVSVPPVEPAPPAVAAPQPTAPAPAVTRVPIAVDIGGLVEVGATKPGLTRIGAGKCKLCHKLQFDSWSKTAHAARTPPLDCESCHGPGSEYKSLAIMKDAKKARSAGMVIPVRPFCSKCHTSGWSDDLLKRTHAHKAGA